MRYLSLNPDLNRFFDDYWSSQDRSSSYDFAETPEHYLFEVDMPGIPKSEIKLEIHDNQLTISGERRSKEGGSRQFARFHQSFTLPAGVDADQVEADYEDGVLKVLLPKAQSAKPRQISIGSNPGIFTRLLGKDKAAKDHSAA